MPRATPICLRFRGRGQSRRLAPGIELLAVVLLSLTVPGCDGCRSEEQVSAEKKQALKTPPKPDFEQFRLLTSPNDGIALQDGIKPGHWTGIVVEDVANNFDFQGRLSLELLNQKGQPLDLADTPFRLQTSRPVLLPKEQRRLLETTLLLPTSALPTRNQFDAYDPFNASFNAEPTSPFTAVSRLASDASGPEFGAVRDNLSPIPDFQYYFVVLSRLPKEYRWLGGQYFIRLTCGRVSDDDLLQGLQYRLILPFPPKRPALPANALAWTPIAYLLWDDWQPSELSADQQQALLDWLHWGGQLIVSGPGSLAGLRGSFLEPYLPAHAGKTRQLEPEVLRSSESYVPEPTSPRSYLKVAQPWSGIELQLVAGASCPPGLDTDGQPLLAERRVGAGRIVVTAFSLAQAELSQWAGCDSFFNACLLRREARRFMGDEGVVVAGWSDPGLHASPEAQLEPEPARATQLRYFSRDTPPGKLRSVAGWNDGSEVAKAARDSLRLAAGIEVPNKQFVVTVLVGYLFVLVPLNWLLFRLLGRVELAWAAAPVIAVACTGLVVWLAQLDIGFARAKSEIGIVEIQGDYPRAHVTRYTALYSSLGTNYRFDFDDPTAVALPFSVGTQTLADQARHTVVLSRRRTAGKTDDDHPGLVSLEDFEVSSNTTGMVHSEQMMDLGGAIELTHVAGNAYRVTNNTRLALQGVLLVRGTLRGWVGALAPGNPREVTLHAGFPEAARKAYDGEAQGTGSGRGAGIHLGKLLEVALAEAPDETWLIARSADELPGMTISPHVAQSRAANLIVARFRRAPLLPPHRDANLPPIIPKDREPLPERTPP